MRRLYVISDQFSRFAHILKRNRGTVLLYALLCTTFLVIGIAVGINIADKTEYALQNKGVIFLYLRGGCGIITFFFINVSITALYAAFCSTMFFTRVTVYLSVTPAVYKSYTIGLSTSVILVVFSASAIPMLFIFFVPISILETLILCVLSKKCFLFNALNGRCFPSKADLKQYYASNIGWYFALLVCIFVKTIFLGMFGSALIGII